jgi:hypothetical protein
MERKTETSDIGAVSGTRVVLRGMPSWRSERSPASARETSHAFIELIDPYRGKRAELLSRGSVSSPNPSSPSARAGASVAPARPEWIGRSVLALGGV